MSEEKVVQGNIKSRCDIYITKREGYHILDFEFSLQMDDSKKQRVLSIINTYDNINDCIPAPAIRVYVNKCYDLDDLIDAVIEISKAKVDVRYPFSEERGE